MDFSVINEFILAVILGITQGITEFLPISSTAHVRIFSALLTSGRDIGLAATNILQLATVLAIITYFWKDLKVYIQRVKEILVNPKEAKIFFDNFGFWWAYPSAEDLAIDKRFDERIRQIETNPKTQTDITISQIIIGTIPFLILGAILYNFAASNRSLQVMAIFLIVGSALMALGEWAHKKALDYPKTRIMGKGEVILVGIFQTLAIFPGMSRSGSTISGALFLGRDRPTSVRFSFLLSIPVVLLAGTIDLLKTILDWVENGSFSLLPNNSAWTAQEISLSLAAIIVGFGVSYIFGLIFLRWLINYLSKNTFKWFIVYRLILAVVLLVLVWLELV